MLTVIIHEMSCDISQPARGTFHKGCLGVKRWDSCQENSYNLGLAPNIPSTVLALLCDHYVDSCSVRAGKDPEAIPPRANTRVKEASYVGHKI